MAIRASLARAAASPGDSRPTWRAIAAADEPKESWYQLLVAIYFELNEYQNAAKAARTMVSIWPEKKSYWEMLQGAYQELGDDFGAMSALQMGWHLSLAASASHSASRAACSRNPRYTSSTS